MTRIQIAAIALVGVVVAGTVFAQMFAIGARARAYTGDGAPRAWCFDTKWRDCGHLDDATDNGAALNTVAIGDVIWIGDPVEEPASRSVGRAHGYGAR